MLHKKEEVIGIQFLVSRGSILKGIREVDGGGNRNRKNKEEKDIAGKAPLFFAKALFFFNTFHSRSHFFISPNFKK